MVGENAYLGIGEVADLCRVTRRTVLNWIAKGRLDATRLPNGRYRVHEAVYKAFVAQRLHAAVRQVRWSWPGDGGNCWLRNGDRSTHRCWACLVYRTHSLHCFSLRRELGDGAIGCDEACAQCAYYRDLCAESAALNIVKSACVLARAGVIIGANVAYRRLLHRDLEDLVGRSWLDTVPPELRAALGERSRSLRNHGPRAPVTVELTLLARDGTRIPTTAVVEQFPRIWGATVTTMNPH